MKRTFTSNDLLRQSQMSADLTRALHNEVAELKAKLSAAEARIAQLESDLERANRTWSVKMSMRDAVNHFVHAECELIDTGHSDRVLIVRCPDAEARIGRLREAVIAQMAWDGMFPPEQQNEAIRRDGGFAACSAVTETLTRCKEHNDLTPPQAEGASDAQP